MKERKEYERETLSELGVEMFKALPDMYRDILLSVVRRIVSEADNSNKPAIDHTISSKDELEADKESTVAAS